MLRLLTDRLIYRSVGVRAPFLMYPFFLMTLAPGIAYVFFTGYKTVNTSILFKLTSVGLGASFLSVWGIVAILAVVLAMINIVFRKKWAGRSAPMLGFMVWSYAFIVYVMNAFTLQAVGFAVPQLIFWAWHYLRVNNYWRNIETGEETGIDFDVEVR